MSKSLFKVGNISGKGAAALICLCLAAVAAAGVYTYSKSDTAGEQLKGTSDAVSEDALGAEAVQNNIPKDNIPAEDMLPVPAEEVWNRTDETEAPAENEEDTMTAPPAVTEPFSSTGVSAGIIIRPVDGEILVGYSDGELVKSKTLNVWKTHDGIDISGEKGDSVRSAAAGTVERVYTDIMWGNCVVISHDGGYESYYYNLGDDVEVSEGDTVSAGTEIGFIGDTAEAESAEDPHLHFGLKKNGSWVDPADALSGSGS